MSQAGSSGWSKSLRSSSRRAELNIRHAAVQPCFPARNHHASSRLFVKTRPTDIALARLKDASLSRPRCSKLQAGWTTKRWSYTDSHDDNVPIRRIAHRLRTDTHHNHAVERAGYLDDGASIVYEPWSSSLSPGYAAIDSVSRNGVCSLCLKEFASQSAFDNHLRYCFPRLEKQSDVDEEHENGQEINGQYQYIEAEVEMLERVRLLEAELRQARSQLKKASRKRQIRQGGNDLVEIYKAAELGPDPRLSEQDYLNLVDVYFNAVQTQSPISPDRSPNPVFLERSSFEHRYGTRDDDTKDTPPIEISMLAHVDKKMRTDKLEEIRMTQNFIELLLRRNSSYDAIYEAYKKFPAPGIRFIPPAAVRTFLYRMSLPPRKEARHMFRYLSIIDEMQEANMPIDRNEWNSAIHLAGRSFHFQEGNDMNRALEYWKKMEQEAGVRSSNATFNILFDVAVKSRRYLLARELLQEMAARGLRLDRIGRVSHIFYCGKIGDANGLRLAYQNFVKAGEVVDTYVLNVVVAGLCTAGEVTSAEQVYERMKQIHLRRVAKSGESSQGLEFARYPPPGSQNIGSYRASHYLRRILLHAPRRHNVPLGITNGIQASAPLSPDWFTYQTLIAYHASSTGDLDRISVLLEEMASMFRLPIFHSIYTHLFRGFALHGSQRSSSWSKELLEITWHAFTSTMKKTHLSAKLADGKGPESLVTAILDDAVYGPDDTAMIDVEFTNGSSGEGSVDNAEVLPEEVKEWNQSHLVPASGKTDVEELRTRIFENGRWGSLLRAFAATPEEKLEADLGDDPAGIEEPSALPPTSSPIYEAEGSQPAMSPNKWLIIWALRAFAACTLDRRRVEEAYLGLLPHWPSPMPSEQGKVDEVLAHCLQAIDRGNLSHQWWRRKLPRTDPSSRNIHQLRSDIPPI